MPPSGTPGRRAASERTSTYTCRAPPRLISSGRSGGRATSDAHVGGASVGPCLHGADALRLADAAVAGVRPHVVACVARRGRRRRRRRRRGACGRALVCPRLGRPAALRLAEAAVAHVRGEVVAEAGRSPLVRVAAAVRRPQLDREGWRGRRLAGEPVHRAVAGVGAQRVALADGCMHVRPPSVRQPSVRAGGRPIARAVGLDAPLPGVPSARRPRTGPCTHPSTS